MDNCREDITGGYGNQRCIMAPPHVLRCLAPPAAISADEPSRVQATNFRKMTVLIPPDDRLQADRLNHRNAKWRRQCAKSILTQRPASA